MSIEKLMQDLIEALDRNTAALGTSKAPKAKDAEKPAKVSVSAPAPTPSEAEAPTLEVTEPEDDQALEIEAPKVGALEIEAPQWPEIVSAFRCFIARHGTTEAVKIMTEFGIKGKLTEDQLPVAKYAKFLQAIKNHGE